MQKKQPNSNPTREAQTNTEEAKAHQRAQQAHHAHQALTLTECRILKILSMADPQLEAYARVEHAAMRALLLLPRIRVRAKLRVRVKFRVGVGKMAHHTHSSYGGVLLSSVLRLKVRVTPNPNPNPNPIQRIKT